MSCFPPQPRAVGHGANENYFHFRKMEMEGKYNTEDKQIKALNQNYKIFLGHDHDDHDGYDVTGINKHYKWGILHNVRKCMEEEDYNVFSNTVSANNRKGEKRYSLESPHNSVHLSLGMEGVDHPETDNEKKVYPIFDFDDLRLHSHVEKAASGDISSNETAAFDPIFYLHHANIGERNAWILL